MSHCAKKYELNIERMNAMSLVSHFLQPLPLNQLDYISDKLVLIVTLPQCLFINCAVRVNVG